MKKAAWFTTLCVLLTHACSGTETQNPGDPTKGPLADPLKQFRASQCKKEAGKSVQSLAAQGQKRSDLATATLALVSTDFAAEVAGLKCVAWEKVGTSGLKVDLYNFEGDCGAEWEGSAAIQDDGSLGLSIINPQCMAADCGWCIFDWSFELEGVELGRPLPVSLVIDSCPSNDSIEKHPVVLPVNTRSTGILCNYAQFDALEWQARALSQCGTEGMPCSDSSNCSSPAPAGEASCQGNLVCTDNGNTKERICAKPCTIDGDCGSFGVSSCQSGLCRPANRW